MKKTILLFLFSIWVLNIKAQLNTFEKYINGFGSFEITDVLEYNQTYYLLCNHSFDTFDQQSSFLLKVNMGGDTISYHGLNISFHYVLRSFVKNINGSLCFVGGIDSLESNFNSSGDGLFVETNLNGDINKSISYPFSTKSEFNNIILDDTVYFATGNKFVTSNNMDLLTVKLDSSGKIKDSLILDFKNVDGVTSLSTFNNNLLISGTILGGSNDGYISILTTDLDTLFFKKFYLFKDFNNRYIKLWYSYSSKFASDSTILFPCVFFVRNPIDTNDWSTYEHSGLIKTDKDGKLLSIHIYYLNCRYDRPMDIFETSDGNYIIAGTINFATRRPIQQSLNGDFYLMKVDTSGNILWFKQYGNSNYQELKSVIKTSDGGFLLSGYSITNYTNQERTGFIVKTDANGNINVGVNNTKISKTKIYPNPAHDFLTIQSGIIFSKYYIINLFGQRIQEGYLTDNLIDINHISNGIYILNLSNNYESIQLKFVKE